MKYLLIIAVILAAGCASNPKGIGAAYVSPLRYAEYDCNQLVIEQNHVTRRSLDLYTSLKKENSKDKWMMGIGLVLFWPSLFALSGGDGPEATEFAQMKGEEEAIRTVMVQKRCALPPTANEAIRSAIVRTKQPVKEIGETEISQTRGVLAANAQPAGLSEPKLWDEYERMKGRRSTGRAYTDDPRKDIPPLKKSRLRDGETVYIRRKRY